jgi:hypothetical protein
MTKTIYIQNKPLQLDPAHLIQSGGEGMVFQAGQTAVKLYHQPQASHQQKLGFFFSADLASKLPPEILAPHVPVTDKKGNLLGFQMPLLPPDAVSIKHLSKAAFWQKNGLTITAVLSLFQQIHATLTTLHALGIVVGDLNDQNIFITPSLCHFMIDVDSYQIGRFPCPVAMDLFVDPNLYGIADLSQRPFFSPATDWYAYFVLLVRSLLHVHPYGGVNHQHKSIAARATAGLSILHPDVAYPANARPPDSLSDDLRHHLHRVFDLGERPPFPVQLLVDYANNALPGSQKPSLAPIPVQTSQPNRLYACTDGFIDSLHALPNGRFLAITFAQNQYKLVRFGLGGVLDERVLFTGNPGYQFAAFQQLLAVNPADSKQVLLLDISGPQPQKLDMLETAMFRETGIFAKAVFAATAHHLYRLAGTWIMRGAMQNGLFVEEAIATAHRNQTWFQASPTSETIAGYHRVFAETRFFLWHNGQSHDLPIPPLQPGESLMETAVTFTSDTVILTLKINQRGKTRTAVYHANHQGQLVPQTNPAVTPLPHTTHLSSGSLSHSLNEIWYQPNK